MKERFEHKALVLMYHRVAELESDVWRLAVSPSHFEQHLEVLQQNWQVVPLTKLAEDLRERKLKKSSVAITFDDGYADNFLVAKPILEKHRIPATFFISSGNIGRQTEFWWDELERIFLLTEELPQTLSIRIGNTQISFNLEQERRLTEDLQEQHRKWKAYVQPPPSLRCTLFLKLWETLKPLTHQAQQEHLHQLKNWSAITYTPRPHYHSIHHEQLQELGQSSFFQIGAHTVSHPDLASLCAQAQEQEILENKAFLEAHLGKEVDLLAYPYGSYNTTTKTIAADTNFKAAVTTKGYPVRPDSERFSLGRFLVDDWTGQQLDKYMKSWLSI